MPSPSFTSKAWEYRPGYLAIPNTASQEWEYWRMVNVTKQEVKTFAPNRTYIKNSYAGPTNFAYGVFMLGSGSCFELSGRDISKGFFLNNKRISSSDMGETLKGVTEWIWEGSNEAPAKPQVDLGSASLATDSLTAAIEAFKAKWNDELSIN